MEKYIFFFLSMIIIGILKFFGDHSTFGSFVDLLLLTFFFLEYESTFSASSYMVDFDCIGDIVNNIYRGGAGFCFLLLKSVALCSNRQVISWSH